MGIQQTIYMMHCVALISISIDAIYKIMMMMMMMMMMITINQYNIIII